MVSALTACAGFLLAVLWMDLMFDSQIASRRVTPEAALESIAAYYHRATTTSQPRGALIAAVMALLPILVVLEVWLDTVAPWMVPASAVTGGGPILLALLRTVPAAVRLGYRRDPETEQRRLARTIYRDHLMCSAGMLCFLALWLVHGLS